MKILIITITLLVEYTRCQIFTDKLFPENLVDVARDKNFADIGKSELDLQIQLLNELEYTSDDVAWTAYGYHERIGIPTAERIRKYESEGRHRRMILGERSHLGEHPYQGGLVITLVQGNTSHCGCSLLSQSRALTAAHCWIDSNGYQASSFEVVLGSTRLFSGGVRITTNDITVHENYDPKIHADDLAMIRFSPVAYSANIGAISLPLGGEVYNDWINWCPIVSGYGSTERGTTKGRLMHTYPTVISNSQCRLMFYYRGGAELAEIVKDSSICTIDYGGAGPSIGDSGGPLAVWCNHRIVLAGVISYGEKRDPSKNQLRGVLQMYTRIDYKNIDWINKQM